MPQPRRRERGCRRDNCVVGKVCLELCELCGGVRRAEPRPKTRTKAGVQNPKPKNRIKTRNQNPRRKTGTKNQTKNPNTNPKTHSKLACETQNVKRKPRKRKERCAEAVTSCTNCAGQKWVVVVSVGKLAKLAAEAKALSNWNKCAPGKCNETSVDRNKCAAKWAACAPLRASRNRKGALMQAWVKAGVALSSRGPQSPRSRSRCSTRAGARPERVRGQGKCIANLAALKLCKLRGVPAGRNAYPKTKHKNRAQGPEPKPGTKTPNPECETQDTTKTRNLTPKHKSKTQNTRRKPRKCTVFVCEGNRSLCEAGT